MTHSQIDSPYSTSGAVPATDSGTTNNPTTADVAKDEARNVGQTAAQAGSQVAGTAADEVKHVAGEAKTQAVNVVQQGRQQVTQQVQTQAKNGQQKAAQGLQALVGELRSMADHSDSSQSGPAHDLIRQATSKVDEVASWIEAREPGDLVEEVRSFARRRPGVFLLGAAVTGVLAGRLTTGVVASHKSQASSAQRLSGGQSGTGANYVEETYTPAAGYTETQTYAAATPAYGSGYSETTTGQVPPPPYGTVPPAEAVAPASTPAGWDDPQRGLGQGGQQ